MKPSVSVIIPTYNRANFLKEAIESVLNQTYSNICEIIITDDNSKDNTSEIVREYMKQNKKIRYVRNNPEHKGVAGNKNNGIRVSKGDFIFILDDDDVLFPDGIESLINVYLNNSEYGIVFGNMERSDKKGLAGYGLNSSQEVSYIELLCGKIRGNFIGIIKRELLKGLKFDEKLQGGESLLWLKLYKKSKVYYLHKKIAIYRIGHDSIISTRDIKPDKQIKIYKKYIEEYGKEYIRYCPCILSKYYANIAYYYLLKKKRKIAFRYLIESIKIKFNIRAVVLLFLLFLNPQIIVYFKNFLFKYILQKY